MQLTGDNERRHWTNALAVVVDAECLTAIEAGEVNLDDDQRRALEVRMTRANCVCRCVIVVWGLYDNTTACGGVIMYRLYGGLIR